MPISIRCASPYCNSATQSLRPATAPSLSREPGVSLPHRRRRIFLIRDRLQPCDPAARHVVLRTARSGAAPCQCATPGGHQITSPVCSSITGPSFCWTNATPSSTRINWPFSWMCHFVRAPAIEPDIRYLARGIFRQPRYVTARKIRVRLLLRAYVAHRPEIKSAALPASMPTRPRVRNFPFMRANHITSVNWGPDFPLYSRLPRSLCSKFRSDK